MEAIGRIVTAFLEFLKMYVLYDYGKKTKENSQLKENEKVRDKHEDIDDMDVAANDAYAEWLRNDK